jgi:hypothetical protein
MTGLMLPQSSDQQRRAVTDTSDTVPTLKQTKYSKTPFPLLSNDPCHGLPWRPQTSHRPVLPFCPKSPSLLRTIPQFPQKVRMRVWTANTSIPQPSDLPSNQCPEILFRHCHRFAHTCPAAWPHTWECQRLIRCPSQPLRPKIRQSIFPTSTPTSRARYMTPPSHKRCFTCTVHTVSMSSTPFANARRSPFSTTIRPSTGK